ncbi:amino acid transporter [Macroventuria anomochaeta]|uniref:Amino acid transporter n=2 Tax=Macroventuria anomochaeta TaxID=301207 RepID=A0ACB6RUH5_9PLEO|nr:amino acid transporter [Macroventuria anomochaeta]XP_033563695.1 amino acid transporter [Macroventuria anomochaeta]KAF2625635.1 amino acid transporter [Macroventuria anomochaeta]KAF2629504.1 amino acid transporter [Macroventuria anomochaeta]
MDHHKEAESHVDSDPNFLDAGEPNALVSEKNGTTADVHDMMRMGKRQETQRNFRHITIIGFCMVILSTWEAILSTAVFSLSNGGTAGLIWGYLICMIGFGFVVASLAEMASMAPTSGGQYHWVSEFAPPSCQRFLSYIVGWLGVLGWQTAAATVSYLTGKQLQALIILWDSSYVPQAWQGTMLIWAVLAVSLIFNTFFSRKLPLVEGVIVVLHVAGFFAVIIPLWVMGDRSNTGDVFTLFQDNMEWGNVPLSTMVGLTGAASCFVGIEAGAHMAEEVRNAAHVIPRAMMWTWIGNGLMGWIMAITFCFCVGDTMSVLLTPLGSQQIQVFLNTTGSAAGATGLTCIMLVIGVFACVAVMATNSRQLFAFARDNGVPFSSIFSQVSPTLGVPLNSVYLTILFVLLLSLINLGSSVAFMQVISLGVAAMLTSYLISIGCVALKRIRGEPLLPSKFNLGRLGLPINIIAVLFLLFLWVFTFFPSAPHPAVADMNWAVLGYGLVIIFALVYYAIHGRHVYIGPVEYVRKGQ